MSILQKALGKDWDKLPFVIQQHYSIKQNSNSSLKGTMDIDFPTLLYPFISLINLCGGLVLKRGKNIGTQVNKTISTDTAELNWQRTLFYPNGEKKYFHSKMQYIQDHELIEKVRFGFGLRLKVSIADSRLVYQSNGHIWQYGALQLIIPDWLLLGNAQIIETAISDQQFNLDFRITHPLWGKSYCYSGIFQFQKK